MSASSTAVSSKPTAGRRLDSAPVRVIALAATFSLAPAYEALRLFALTDADIWWHLRTGLWILQNHAIPRSGLFSQLPALFWVDSSWGFDLLTAIGDRLLGLAGIPVLLVVLQLAIAVMLFFLAFSASRSFWPSVILSAVAQCCLAPMAPRPALCSIVLLGLELSLLLGARRTGNPRALFWLAPLFLLWANLDRQFSYGLLTLALFFVAVVIEQLGRQSGVAWLETGLPVLRLSSVAAAAGVSLLATFITPYGYRLHQLLWRSATSTAADRYFRELHPMRFRQPRDFLLLLLTMTAFFALGRRRSRDLFLLALLIVSAILSFRLQRDVWLLAVVAVGVIASQLGLAQAREASAVPLRSVEQGGTSALVVLILLTATLRLSATEALAAKVSETFPVRASDFIRQNHLPQPIFNTYPWGGFLTWYLPEYPVVIDSRAELYGDGFNLGYFKVMQAEVPLESYPGFVQAQTILLEADSAMAQALSTLPGFRIAYKDDQAVVLVRGR